MPEAEENAAEYFARADAFIRLANQQCETVGPEKVIASFMYGLARFCAWDCARCSSSVGHMRDVRNESIEYCLERFRGMLVEHIDDHIQNYSEYMPKSIL